MTEAGAAEPFVAVVDASGLVEAGSAEAIVPWWSFSKTLVAVAALRLVEQGRLALDEPVMSLPYTLRQLLQHRSGLADYGPLADYHAAVARADPPWSHEELFALVPLDETSFRPDEGWAYSNVGYLIVRLEVERVYDDGLEVALRDLVLEPLGARSSRLAMTQDDMRQTVFERAHGYHPGWVFHGCVIGPVAEAALTLHRLLRGDLLGPRVRSAWLDRHAIGGPLPGRPWQTTGYGLGLMMGAMLRPGMTEALEVVGHSAGGPGSVGAVYGVIQDGQVRTAAAFVAGTDEAVPEDAMLRRLARG